MIKWLRCKMDIKDIYELREKLEPHFSRDTAFPGSPTVPPSSGHCAVVAIIAHLVFGANIVSSIVKGQSHWFNRAVVTGYSVDFDMTADQFGFPAVLVAGNGALYPGTRERQISEANTETLKRAKLLALRACIWPLDV